MNEERANINQAEEMTGEDMTLRPVTVRFTGGAWEAIRDIAAERQVSVAELVRRAVAGNLADYLGSVKFIDSEQGEEIKAQITALFDTVSQIQMEPHRIGVNFNQEIKIQNIQRKYRITSESSFEDIMKRRAEIEAVKKDSNLLDKAELDALMERYEIATKQVGEMLCLILA